MKNYIYLFLLSILLLTGCDNKKNSQSSSDETPTTNQNNEVNTNTQNDTTDKTTGTTNNNEDNTIKSSNDNKSQLPTQVTNSYLFHTEPELLPNKKLIKQQTIQSSDKKSINYNDKGYVKDYDLEGLYGEINYDTSKYIYGMKDTRNSYDITFDESKNIIGMKNSNDEIVAISEFDEQGRLVETTLSNFADNNINFTSKIIYENDLVEQVLYNAYVKMDDKKQLPVLVREKDVIYNANKQLEKTITRTFKLSAKGEVIINDKNEQELESTETCNYSEYNQNNDWTKAVCETTGNGSSKINLTRTIEYL